jgi:hypothetical protein
LRVKSPVIAASGSIGLSALEMSRCRLVARTTSWDTTNIARSDPLGKRIYGR